MLHCNSSKQFLILTAGHCLCEQLYLRLNTFRLVPTWRDSSVDVPQSTYAYMYGYFHFPLEKSSSKY